MAWYWIIFLVVASSLIAGAFAFYYGFMAGMSAADWDKDYEFGKN